MHFHLPKPLHGWREFLGEVGIIVVGVLIALGAEQVVEKASWREKARNADEVIKEEVGSNAINLAERIAVQPCLRQQISKLANQLNSNQMDWRATPVELDAATIRKAGWVGPVLVPAYRPPSRIWLDDRWASARADGTLPHLPLERAEGYEIIYRSIDQMSALQTEEASAASKLAYLASDRKLSETDRVTMFAALSEVDRVNSLMALISSQTLESIASLHLGFDRHVVERDQESNNSYERSLRGNCVHPARLNLH